MSAASQKWRIKICARIASLTRSSVFADVGPDTEFVGNPVTIRMTDGRSYSARVDVSRGDPALPLTDDELLVKYRDCSRSQLRPDDIERSVGQVLGLEKVGDVGTLMAILRAPAGKA